VGTNLPVLWRSPISDGVRLSAISRGYLGDGNEDRPGNPGDTIIKLNNDLHYKLTLRGDTAYFVTWGNKSTSFTSKPMEVLGSGLPELLDYSDTCILLGQSCGTSCTLYVFLPIVSNATERQYLFGKAYNLEENTVAFIPDGDPLISVQNYLTNKRMDVFENNLCSAAFKGDCIDSCKITNSTFYLYWHGEKRRSNKKSPRKKVYNIDLK
jgi:hypothetical protein